MRDFASAHYLGMNHPLPSLASNCPLTTGRPAVADYGTMTAAIRSGLRSLLRVDHLTIRRSTLHAFVDYYRGLSARDDAIILDRNAYPLQRSAVEMARGRGVPVRLVDLHARGALRLAVREAAGSGRRPYLGTDGYCPRCGVPIDYKNLLDTLRPYGGVLVVDDTQSSGVLGAGPSSGRPWGEGGGGSHVHAGVERDGNLVVVTSFAKGFGAPVAAIGTNRRLALPAESGGTETHASGPTNADYLALHRALAMNRRDGNQRRAALLENVRLFRHVVRSRGRLPRGGLFPVQTFAVAAEQAARIDQELRSAGVRTILTQLEAGQAGINFILSTRHRASEVEQAARLAADALPRNRLPVTRFCYSKPARPIV